MSLGIFGSILAVWFIGSTLCMLIVAVVRVRNRK